MSQTSTRSRFSRRRVGGFLLGAAAFALLSLSPSGASASGGGSIAVSVVICPTPADTVTLYNCTTADGVGEMIITSEDDSIVLTVQMTPFMAARPCGAKGITCHSVSTSSTTLG